MSVDTTVTIPDALATHYDAVFLEAAKDLLQYKEFATMKPLPENTGKTTDIFSYREQALLTAALTEGTLPTETNITGFNVTATVEEWGDFSKASTLFKLTTRDKNLEEYIKVKGRAMARQYDHLLAVAQSTTGGFPVRVDNSATYTVTGTADSGTTSTLVDDALTQSDNHFNGGRGIITGTSSTNTTFCRPINLFTASSDTVTFCGDYTIGTRTPPVFEAAIDNTDVYRLCSPTGLTSSNVITSDALKLCVAHLKRNGAPTFENGFFKAGCSINVGYDLRKDSEFELFQQNAAEYFKESRQGPYKPFGGYWGIQMFETTQPYRQGTTDYSYDAAGAVHITSVFGSDSLAALELDRQGQHVWVKNPGPGDTSQPIPRYSTVGWMFIMIALALNPMFSVNLFSGSSMAD